MKFHTRAAVLRVAMPGVRRSFAALSYRSAQRVGAVLGRLAWRAVGRDRRRALAHLAIAFPELDAASRRRLGRASFRHLGTAFGELMHVYGRDPADALRHVAVAGAEELLRPRDAGRAVVALTAHCGNWELLSLVNLTHDVGLRALARAQDDPTLDDTVVGLRAHLGTETVGRGRHGARGAMLRVLRDGGVLAMLIDQDIAADSVWVPFFGRLAHTPVVAATLALRYGAAVVPGFAERRPDGTHLVRFQPALDLPVDPTAATAVMTRAIEDQIRRVPEQWVWMHRRWRRRPAGEQPSGPPL